MSPPSWTRDKGDWVSEPLVRLSGRRLRIACADDEGCRELLAWAAESAPAPKRRGSTEPFAFGYWLLRSVADRDGDERIEELTSDGSEFVAWVHNAPRFWRIQREVCAGAGSVFLPPRPDQLVAVSAGVMGGDPVAGVRYAAPPHMSGWYLTTGQYKGDVTSLTLEHMVHVTHARPDLARFIALAPGYRFHSEPDAAAWYDPVVGSQK